MVKPTYKQLQQRLKQAKSDYRFMASKEVRCFGVEENLKKEIYSIDAELKRIDEEVGVVYKNGAYVGDYKPFLTTSFIIKMVIYISIVALIINIIMSYLPDVKPVDSEGFPVELFMFF